MARQRNASAKPELVCWELPRCIAPLSVLPKRRNMELKAASEIAVALADDDSDLRQLLVRMVGQLGYRVVCAASNGAELLESCLDIPVDVVLVDLEMPLVDGLEAAEEFARRQVPVVLISGLPDTRHMVLEKEPVAVRLSKPVTSEAIKAAIETALNRTSNHTV